MLPRTARKSLITGREHSLRCRAGMPHYPHVELTNLIINAAYCVFRELGHGFAEIVYRRALAIVLRENGLAAREECPVNVSEIGRRRSWHADQLR